MRDIGKGILVARLLLSFALALLMASFIQVRSSVAARRRRTAGTFALGRRIFASSVFTIAFLLIPLHQVAHAAPISLDADEVLIVSFELPAAAPQHNSLFLAWEHEETFTGDFALSLFEGNILLETMSGPMVNKIVTDTEFYSSVAPFPNTGSTVTAMASDFAAIADGISNGRIEFSYSAPITLPNDCARCAPELLPFVTEGAFAIFTTERLSVNMVATDARNFATITSVIPEPSTGLLFASGLLSMAAARRSTRRCH